MKIAFLFILIIISFSCSSTAKLERLKADMETIEVEKVTNRQTESTDCLKYIGVQIPFFSSEISGGAFSMFTPGILARKHTISGLTFSGKIIYQGEKRSNVLSDDRPQNSKIGNFDIQLNMQVPLLNFKDSRKDVLVCFYVNPTLDTGYFTIPKVNFKNNLKLRLGVDREFFFSDVENDSLISQLNYNQFSSVNYSQVTYMLKAGVAFHRDRNFQTVINWNNQEFKTLLSDFKEIYFDLKYGVFTQTSHLSYKSVNIDPITNQVYYTPNSLLVKDYLTKRSIGFEAGFNFGFRFIKSTYIVFNYAIGINPGYFDEKGFGRGLYNKTGISFTFGKLNLRNPIF